MASPDEPDGAENLPGELLGEDLTDPESFSVAPDESEAEELDQADDAGESDDVVVDDEKQLAAAQTVADRARSSRPKRRSESGSSRSRGSDHDSHPSATPQRTSPARFVRQSADELRKVTWPTWPQVQQLFWAVLVLVLFVIAFVVSLDTLFGWVLLRLFG